MHGVLEERCGSVVGTAEKHVWDVVVSITWGVTDACGKRRGRCETFQGRFRSVRRDGGEFLRRERSAS